MMKIKVCGITTLEQLESLQTLGVDYTGLIFYDKSPRYARDKLWFKRSEIKKLNIPKVGVFINSDKKDIIDTIKEFSLDAVQLHGDENVEFTAAIQTHIPVIKAFRLKGKENVKQIVKGFQNKCSYFLFDTAGKGYGGTGEKFDWSVLEGIEKPFFLSGGISVADAESLKVFNRVNELFAVDINSRFELKPGIKDLKKIAVFKEGLD